MKLVIGLTGEIGAGKSTVARRLEELGATVIDADRVGHEVLKQPDTIETLTEAFGNEMLAADGSIDRRKLAEIVFADPQARTRLERIVHPRMVEQFEAQIARAQTDSSTAVTLDAAILYEAGWDSLCDRVLVVTAPRQMRLQRLAASRGWSEHDLSTRERAQAPIESKRRRADAVIENAGSPAACLEQVDELFRAWVGDSACPSIAKVSSKTRN